MCGILTVLGHKGPMEDFRARALSLSKRIRHRGPDWSGCCIANQNIFVHERLAIVGIDSGQQPLTTSDGSIILCVNGEIYNHKQLEKQLRTPRTFQTQSDCEVILYLYEELGEDFVHLLDGMFSFVLYDAKKDRFMAARDPLGITTLYYGQSKRDGSVWFASELKCLNEDCDEALAWFPPGHVYSSATATPLRPYYLPEWGPVDESRALPEPPSDDASVLALVRETLEKAVRKRLMCETPYGVLLSGGLDSSLIAAIAAEQVRQIRETRLASPSDEVARLAGEWPTLHSFAIGLAGSPDLDAAARAAEFLGTRHRGFHFTVQEGLDAIPDVIYHLETYDVTTVRASTPMYLLSRKIKASGVKMVLSGEGSDELFAGYLYFASAPSAAALHNECVSRVRQLHLADCLRANKSTMAWGVEARVPFLDKEFVDVALRRVHPSLKLVQRPPFNNPMEKNILRKAFDTNKADGRPYLPREILWRQKEQFSDGVGYSWIDGVKAHAERIVTDAQLAAAAARWPHNTPATKEAYWFRDIFDQHFPQPLCERTVSAWVPRQDWGCSADPSGRAQSGHKAAYGASS